MSDESDERDSAKCSKCFDTGTVYESHGPGGSEAVECEAPGCAAVPREDDAYDAADFQAAMSSGMR